MDKGSFKRLKLREKHRLIKADGTYLASRLHNGYQCYLVSLYGFYVEWWRPIGFASTLWIEVVESDETLNHYLDQITLP